MSEEIEAVGTAIEGALVGAAVEGEISGRGKKAGGNESENCLNCGAAVAGSFCPNCGQKAHIHRSIAAIWHDILYGVLHFDGKMWRTLPMLAFKPGELTRRYIHGERASFISPMTLFLFSIFMMFAIFSFTGGPTTAKLPNDAFNESVNKELAGNQKLITAKEKKLQSGTLSPETAKGEQAELLALKKTHNDLSWILGKALPYPEVGLHEDEGAIKIDSGDGVASGATWLQEKLEEGAKKANKNPSLLLYKLKSNGYKFAWLLIPLSLPFVWLVTIGAGGGLRAHKFYDHAVFTTYSIAFMSLLFLLCALLVKAGWDGAWFGMLLIPPVHLYNHLRHAYQLSRFSAILRLLALFVSIVIVVTLFLLILLFLGILG